MEQTILWGGLECVAAFLKRVQKLVLYVDVSFDEIQAAARALRRDAICEIWKEKGFDRSGSRLSVPVEGHDLTADALAKIAALPQQQQVDRLLEEISAFIVNKPQRAPETQLGAVTTESTVHAATKRGKPGRPKEKPETEEYRFVEQLLCRLNEDARIKLLDSVVSKDDLRHIVECDHTKFQRFETNDPGLSKSESDKIWAELRRPMDQLVEELVRYKQRHQSNPSLE
jgi:hypothetical protein